MSARALCAAIALGLSPGLSLPAFADPPPAKCHGHDDRREGHDRDRGREPSSSVNINIEFHDNDRMAVRDYYADLGHRGRCPPGLAKQHDRCMPPGQPKHGSASWRERESQYV